MSKTYQHIKDWVYLISPHKLNMFKFYKNKIKDILYVDTKTNTLKKYIKNHVIHLK